MESENETHSAGERSFGSKVEQIEDKISEQIRRLYRCVRCNYWR